MTKPRFNQNWNDLAVKIGYADERDMLEQMYVVQELSYTEISARLEVSTAALQRHLKLNNISARSRGGANADAKQTRSLFRLDQRVVLRMDLNLLSRITGVSRALCYKYRISQTGGKSNEVLHPLPNSGVGTLRDAESNPLTPSSVGQTEGV